MTKKATNLEIPSDFTCESLKGELVYERLGRLLVTSDITKRDGTESDMMKLLDTASSLSRGSNNGQDSARDI